MIVRSLRGAGPEPPLIARRSHSVAFLAHRHCFSGWLLGRGEVQHLAPLAWCGARTGLYLSFFTEIAEIIFGSIPFTALRRPRVGCVASRRQSFFRLNLPGASRVVLVHFRVACDPQVHVLGIDKADEVGPGSMFGLVHRLCGP